MATTIAQAIRAGLPYKFAALRAGVHERTLFRWLKAGRAATTRTPERQLCQRIEKAQAAAVEERIKRIGRAGRKNWKADAWWLERTHPDYYAADRRDLAAVKKELAAVVAELHTLRATGAGGSEARPAARSADDRPAGGRPPSGA